MVTVHCERRGSGLQILEAEPSQFTSLKAAKDYAVERVKASDPAEKLQATVKDGKRIKYRCRIDASGQFHEEFGV